MVDKYIGRIVEIIYLDRKEVIKQRKIEVLGVQEGRVRVWRATGIRRTMRIRRRFRREERAALIIGHYIDKYRQGNGFPVRR